MLIIIFSIPLHAVDFIIGAKGGYFVWKPYFEDIGGFFDNIDTGTGVLYGPVISILFTEDISLSIAGLTGIQSTHWTMDFEQEGDPDDIRAATSYWKSERYDVDTALSYRVMPQIKIFLGYKYQYIDSTIKYTEARTDASNQLTDIQHVKDGIETMSSGPALGIGYSLPFGKGYFAAVNISGLYMLGYFKSENDFVYDYNSGTNSFDKENWDPLKVDIRQAGINLEPSIGFMPEGSGLVLTLGLRYQWLRTNFQDMSHEEKDSLGTKTLNDYLYGVFVSVLYTF